MQTLYAPWRFSYVSVSTRSEGCFFCEAAAEPENPERLVVHISKNYLVMLNLHPYTNGHLMVAPLKHVETPLAMNAEESSEFWPLILRSQEVLEKAYSPEGFNLGLNLGRAAGAGVPDHFHFHIVPRWGGDTNFMSVVAGVRVVPEEPSRILQKLRPLFAEI
jgi:ATP adenylyltransferase